MSSRPKPAKGKSGKKSKKPEQDKEDREDRVDRVDRVDREDRVDRVDRVDQGAEDQDIPPKETADIHIDTDEKVTPESQTQTDAQIIHEDPPSLDVPPGEPNLADSSEIKQQESSQRETSEGSQAELVSVSDIHQEPAEMDQPPEPPAQEEDPPAEQPKDEQISPQEHYGDTDYSEAHHSELEHVEPAQESTFYSAPQSHQTTEAQKPEVQPEPVEPISQTEAEGSQLSGDAEAKESSDKLSDPAPSSNPTEGCTFEFLGKNSMVYNTLYCSYLKAKLAYMFMMKNHQFV